MRIHTSSRYNEVVGAWKEEKKEKEKKKKKNTYSVIFSVEARSGGRVIREFTEVQSRPLVDRIKLCVGSLRGVLKGCSVRDSAAMGPWSRLFNASDKSLKPVQLSTVGK